MKEIAQLPFDTAKVNKQPHQQQSGPTRRRHYDRISPSLTSLSSFPPFGYLQPSPLFACRRFSICNSSSQSLPARPPRTTDTQVWRIELSRNRSTGFVPQINFTGLALAHSRPFHSRWKPPVESHSLRLPFEPGHFVFRLQQLIHLLTIRSRPLLPEQFQFSRRHRTNTSRTAVTHTRLFSFQ